MSVFNFIAHFLKENGYEETLKTFEKEHGSQISTDLPHDEALTDIITDRMKYLTTQSSPDSQQDNWLDKDLAQIKASQFKEWSVPYPKKLEQLASLNELIISTDFFNSNGKAYLIGGTSGKSLVVFDLETGKKVVEIKDVIGKVVIRRIVVSSQYVLLCGMNGKVYVGSFSNEMDSFDILFEEQIHARLITDVSVVLWKNEDHLVTMGWDFLVKVWKITSYGLQQLGEPYKLASQGTCFDVCTYNDVLYVAVGKNEITLMDVLRMDGSYQLCLDCRIALNDAEFSASGFTPMCIKILNQEGIPLVAVGTSHEPYMRVVIVTLKDVGSDAADIKRNQIIANINTMSPQDKYSQANIAWRYDGSGLWIMGEDGCIRGLDISKQTVAVELKEHEGRIKSSTTFEDVIVTCGTDKQILKWSHE